MRLTKKAYIKTSINKFLSFQQMNSMHICLQQNLMTDCVRSQQSVVANKPSNNSQNPFIGEIKQRKAMKELSHYIFVLTLFFYQRPKPLWSQTSSRSLILAGVNKAIRNKNESTKFSIMFFFSSYIVWLSLLLTSTWLFFCSLMVCQLSHLFL